MRHTISTRPGASWRAQETYNIAVCTQFLQAARVAVLGLEDELDEILIEAGPVARYGRISEYLNRDRLRTALGESLEGVGACYKFAAQDADGFFQRRTTQAQKNEDLETRLRHFSELSGFLKSVSATMEYARVNFAGKSGIDVAELLEAEGLLDDFKDAGKDVQTRKREIRTKMEAAQENRKRHGLPLVANTKRVIQELCVSFRVTTMAEPPKQELRGCPLSHSVIPSEVRREPKPGNPGLQKSGNPSSRSLSLSESISPQSNSPISTLRSERMWSTSSLNSSLGCLGLLGVNICTNGCSTKLRPAGARSPFLLPKSTGCPWSM